MRRARPHRLIVNGAEHRVEAEETTPLLTILRNDLRLTSPKFGCGYGECGACTVLIEGRAARSCMVPVGLAEGRAVVTLEGLAADGPDPVQQAFIDAEAAQCGYCLTGMIMTAKALLIHNPAPDEAAIREALRHNLCRCGTHIEILEAVKRAAGLAP